MIRQFYRGFSTLSRQHLNVYNARYLSGVSGSDSKNIGLPKENTLKDEKNKVDAELDLAELDDDLTAPIRTSSNQRAAASTSFKASSDHLHPREVPYSGASSDSGDNGETIDAPDAATARQYLQLRRAMADQIERIRRFDTAALSTIRSQQGFAVAPESDVNIFDGTSRSTVGEPGLPIDYCVFCYHGSTKHMRADNTALLSKFVTDNGSLLPRRFTRCCAKHQRSLARTIKRARWLNLLPFHSKLHPQARFNSMSPNRDVEEGLLSSNNPGALPRADTGSSSVKKEQGEMLEELSKN